MENQIKSRYTQNWMLFIGVLLGFTLGQAMSQTILRDENKRIFLGNDIEIYIDPSNRENIQSISAPEFSRQFKKSEAIFPNLGRTNATVWVRFSITNITYVTHWALQVAYSDLENIELYKQNEANWQIKELGSNLPFFSREIVNRNFFFELDLPSNKAVTFYLRYQNSNSMVIPLVIFSNQQYQIFALKEQFWFGLYFGLILVISVYTLILFIKVSEANYLYYFFYITGYTFFQFTLLGFSYQYFWPNSAWLASKSIMYFLSFSLFFRLLFSMSALASRKNSPIIHTIAKAVLGLSLTYLATSFISAIFFKSWALFNNPIVELWVVALFDCAFVLIMLAINLQCSRNNIPSANTFLFASLFMVLGISIYVLKSLGHLPSNFFTENGILAASLIEIGYLFISLGEKIEAMKKEAKEKHEHQQATLQAFHNEQIRSMRLDLELLKANIRPHFILNSLNAATMWLSEDPKITYKLLQALSDELRQLLKMVDRKTIPVHDEIQLCKDHLILMGLRLDKNFTLTLDSIIMDELIPPLVIHTLIENGITHGFANKKSGTFKLSRSEDEDEIEFTLLNDGDPISGKGESLGLGLRYVRARLEETFSGRWDLISLPTTEGWEISFRIKKAGPGTKI